MKIEYDENNKPIKIEAENGMLLSTYEFGHRVFYKMTSKNDIDLSEYEEVTIELQQQWESNHLKEESVPTDE